MTEPTIEALERFHRETQERIDALVAKGSWLVMAIAAEDGAMPAPKPTFSYTIGLTEHGLPEVILAGLNPVVSRGILNPNYALDITRTKMRRIKGQAGENVQGCALASLDELARVLFESEAKADPEPGGPNSWDLASESDRQWYLNRMGDLLQHRALLLKALGVAEES